MLLMLALPIHVAAWGAGHPRISRAALPLQPAELQTLLHDTNATVFNVTSSIDKFLTGLVQVPWPSEYDWSELPDKLAGPCQATPNCSSIELSGKLWYRQFCYAENASAAPVLPWPYDIPACSATRTTGCLPGPKVESWLYHYFDSTPSANAGIEARGASWYVSKAAAALRAGHVDVAFLHLGCFAHALQDRSSPYHAFGGAAAAKQARAFFASVRCISTDIAWQCIFFTPPAMFH